MKFIINITTIFSFLIHFSCETPKAETIESEYSKIEQLISEMTIEEKVGQMTQLTLVYFYKDGFLQEDMLIEHMEKYNIGSILNITESALSNKEWIELISKIQDAAMKSRLKIPVLYGIDAIHGATYTQNSTLFPHNIGLAASRNPQLAFNSAQITAKEIRAGGVRWNFDPVFGVGRQPLWPRFEETYGEDPLLVADFGCAAVNGYEGDDLSKNTNVASCMKHFIGYSVPKSGKDRSPAYISDIEFHEIFAPPFIKAIKCGSASAMINSGSINGIPVHANKKLLTDLLKNEWGYEGFLVTDWLDIINLHTDHMVTTNNKESVKLAINAGIDMSMVPNNLSFYDDLVELVKEGEVDIERINDAVRRILKVKFELGLFENPYPEKEAESYFGRKSYQNEALKAASETMTLLKNDSINGVAVLPLNKNSKVLIAGPCANSLSALHGSWSYSWDSRNDSLYPESTLTISEAIINKTGKQNCNVIAPPKYKEYTSEEIKKVMLAAKNADYILLCLGENGYAESDGNIDDLTLAEEQIKLAQAATATQKPVIVVLTEGRPRIINKIADEVDAILMAYRPGSQGAIAIADVLFGDYNPAGRLPFSYPRYTGNLYTYDAPVRNTKYYNPQWEFGYGLSYSKIVYSNIKLSSDTLQSKDTLNVNIAVKNQGKMATNLAVDLFVKDVAASVIPAMKKLRKYKRIFLKSGELKEIEFQLTKDDLAFVGQDLKWITENGEFGIMLGDKKASFIYQK